MIDKFVSKLSAREKTVLNFTIAFVLIAFLDRLFLGPALSRMAYLDGEIKEQKSTIERDLKFLSHKESILKTNDDFTIYYTMVIQTEEEIIATFLKRIEMLATDAGVNLIKISPSEAKQKKGYVEYYANLECSGALENVATFMHLIDSSEDLLKVIKMNITPKRASAHAVNTTMSVKKLIIGASQESMAEANKLKEKEFSKDKLIEVKSEGEKEQGAQNENVEGRKSEVSIFEKITGQKDSEE